MQLNYALDRNNYTWTNALCWGNCFKHFEKAKNENSIVHGLIAVVELLPIISQIASIFEKIIVDCLRGKANAPSLTDRDIAIGIANDPMPPFSALKPRSIEDMLNRFRALPGVLIREEPEQVEVALDGEGMGQNPLSPWKLHISANPENAVFVFQVVFGTLVRERPYFTCVRNEQLLQQHNAFACPERGHYKEGKFITIYMPQGSEEELLKLASLLNESLQEAIDDGRLQRNSADAAVNRTDRPIGSSGFLWARHGQAVGPLAEQELLQPKGDAEAIEGNYNVTTRYPDAWKDLPAAELQRRIQAKEEGLATEVQPDIFTLDWGTVTWNPQQRRFISNPSI